MVFSGSEDESLTLGLGFAPPPSSSSSLKPTKTPNNYNLIPWRNNQVKQVQGMDREPSLTLSLSGDPPCSVVSAAASGLVAVKRERESGSSDELEMERGSNSRVSDEEEDGYGGGPTTAARKKLRLTKEQSALLEESFKQHSTLNPKQKEALADRLNLRARQVEVWFQNRRARTKLKQTEVDCEYLKKCCETLTDENRRLQKELQELKALKLGHPSFYMQLPAATLRMCPSCERIGGTPVPILGTTASSAPKSAFTVGPSKSHFYPSPSVLPLLVD